jgi:hypothetical protein
VHGSYRLNQRVIQEAPIEILSDEPRWKREAWFEQGLIALVLGGGLVQAAVALFRGF